MTPNADRLVWIYCLKDPRDGLPFYVGATQDPDARLKSHLQGQKSGPLKSRFAEIENAGKQPEMVCLEQTTARKAPALENQWIHSLREQGVGVLNLVLNKPDARPHGKVALTREQRRAVQLAVLSGEDALEIANRYGISRQRVYSLRDEAKETAEEELEHWRRVTQMLRGRVSGSRERTP